MAIPDYETFMSPMLIFLNDDQEHAVSEIVNKLADHFNITEDEKNIRIPSGTASLLRNRIGWAQTSLKKAGLIDNSKRAIIQITDKGKEALIRYGNKIDSKILLHYPDYVKFRQPLVKGSIEVEIPEDSQKTPDEAMSSAYETINNDLADEILSRVLAKSPAFFESLVAKLLVAMGYGGSESDILQSAGGKGDGGIDGVIKQDKLGLDIVYVQAKRFKKETSISPHDVRDFIGALSYKGAKKGVFITTSSFSKEAQKVPENDTKVILIDGEKLAEYMIEFGVGVSVKNTFVIKEIDNDFFDDDY